MSSGLWIGKWLDEDSITEESEDTGTIPISFDEFLESVKHIQKVRLNTNAKHFHPKERIENLEVYLTKNDYDHINEAAWFDIFFWHEFDGTILFYDQNFLEYPDSVIWKIAMTIADVTKAVIRDDDGNILYSDQS